MSHQLMAYIIYYTFYTFEDYIQIFNLLESNLLVYHIFKYQNEHLSLNLIVSIKTKSLFQIIPFINIYIVINKIL